jgi:heme-degrading monooxygenase HmoA
VADFARTPEPPYTAVIFTSRRTSSDDQGYGAAADRMEELAAQQPGYLGIESVKDDSGFGITVSYWADETAATAWRSVGEHREVQRLGRERWYEHFEIRVATVGRARTYPTA